MQGILKKAANARMLNAQDVRSRRNPRDLSFAFFSILLVFAFIVVASVFLWSRLGVVNIGYGISKANEERSALIEKNKRLRLELTRLKSPERIEKVAHEDLLLSPPTGEQIVDIK
ncbi:MAG: cell division protein FtsL [Deltaproteobacteria bacterium]